MDSRTLAQITRLLRDAATERDETVADGLARYIETRVVGRGLKHRTVRDTLAALDRLAGRLGDLRLDELTERDAADWLAGVPTGSRTREYSAVAAALRWLGVAEVLPRKPRARRYTDYLADEEMAAMWDAIAWGESERWVRWWMADCLRVGMLTALRRGELASLRWVYVDRPGEQLRLRATKTGDRVVPLGSTALAILDRQPRRAPFVWPGRDSGHVNGNSLHQAWAKVRRRAGLRPVRFHAIRHSWASKCLRDGDSLARVGRVLGHSTQTMSEYYAHCGAADVRDLVDRAESTITGGDR